MSESTLIQPEQIHAEFERMYGAPVKMTVNPASGDSVPVYAFGDGGKFVAFRVFDADRAMSLDAFSRRVLWFPVQTLKGVRVEA